MFQLQGKDKYGNWSAENVSHDPYATDFETESEALEERDYWIKQGRSTNDLRIVEV